MGRPSKLTEEVATTICVLLSDGAFLEHAAEKAGVGASTVHEWIQRGEKGEVGHDGADYAKFAERCARARAEGEHGMLARIRDMGEETRDWKAVAWHLERLNPARYKATSRQEVTGADGGPVEVVTPVLILPTEKPDDE